MLCTSTWAGFEPTALVVIGTDCICSCKSNYHEITATTAPCPKWNEINNKPSDIMTIHKHTTLEKRNMFYLRRYLLDSSPKDLVC
jgi:hypothetical protein